MSDVFHHLNGVTVTRWLRFEKMCEITKKPHRVHVRLEDWMRVEQGEVIQKVLRDYTECDREFLISGTTPAEWNDMVSHFPDESNELQTSAARGEDSHGESV